MTAADIPAGLRLNAQNGWNQLARDWQRQLDLEPDGCFAAELDGQIVGTACTCVFENVAWVNLVLVDQVYRGRGIGTSLMRRVLAYLDERRIASIRLDATPLGRPIYEKLGFEVDFELKRYEGTLRQVGPGHVDVAVAGAHDLDDVIRLDRQVTETPRGRLLGYVHAQQLDPLLIALTGRGITGYASYRPGMRAWQIGPCLGEANACRALLSTIAGRLEDQPVYLDVADLHVAANAFATRLNLSPQRQLTRMTRGVHFHEDMKHYWCSFGPEKG
ncbi:MAG: GNAT family N-acetyltransferase [Gemmataceae bacterium]|nr:GNAT family N-acetyltransferase [Gemmataceae bacterium]